MGRCSCSGSRCSCVIKQGAGAQVTGAGSADDPYVIALDGEGGGGTSGWDPGDIKWTGKPAASAGWLIADGSNVSRALQPALFAAIGTRFGAGDGSTTFTLPDLTGRFPLGADGSHTLGATGGAESATIGATNLPPHTHAHTHTLPLEYNTNTATDSSTNGFRVTDIDDKTGGGGTNVAASTSSSSTGGTANGPGTSQPVSIMPPWAALTPLIKT